jgi:hypothetical protein
MIGAQARQCLPDRGETQPVSLLQSLETQGLAGIEGPVKDVPAEQRVGPIGEGNLVFIGQALLNGAHFIPSMTRFTATADFMQYRSFYKIC